MRPHRQRNAGQDLVEYAIILPLLLLLLLGIAEFAIIVFTYDTLGNAAREGARYGVVHPTDQAGICNAARRLTSGLDSGAITCDVILPGSNTIQVEMGYDYGFIAGNVMAAAGGQPTIHLSSAATMRIE
jgi:hypothetical protein